MRNNHEGEYNTCDHGLLKSETGWNNLPLDASNVGLVGENTTYMLRPGIVGMRGSMVIRLRSCMRSSASLLSNTHPGHEG